MGLVSSFSWSLERENASNRIHVTEITGAWWSVCWYCKKKLIMMIIIIIL
jgi:hypothetical protein